MRDNTRNRGKVVFLGLLILLLLGNCSCEASLPKISNLNHTQTIPINPKRLVVLDSNFFEDVLALGIIPAGAPKQYVSYLQEIKGISPITWQNIQETGAPWLPVNLENILAMKPDMILTSKYRQEIYPLLSKIAPTVLIDPKSGNSDWETVFYLIADALNQKNKAVEILSDYQNRLQKFKKQMGTRLASTQVSIVYAKEQSSISLFNKEFFGGKIVEQIGLSRPPSQTVDGTFIAKMFPGYGSIYLISWEKLSDADGDVMFVVSDDIRQRNTAWEQIRTQPLWSKLKVVQQHKVHQVNFYWFGFGPIAANQVVDDLEKYVLYQNEGIN
ncbi:MAG: iron-siderophore ABC transporter substrate-binding protein [Nostoc sp.]|uniref:iron-siderophore ABC transporter substrate-binding protein n=1 Tax=Nostoc sp. TaxID=1180 RepID=UPI002FF2DE96